MRSFRIFHPALYPVALTALGLAAHGQMRISEVFTSPVAWDHGDQMIELYNAGDESIELQNYVLCIGDARPPTHGCLFALPDFALPPESYVRVHWGEDGEDSLPDLYTGVGFDVIPHPIGSVALLDGDDGAILDYVQWGGDCFTAPTAELFGQWTVGTWVEPPMTNDSLAFDGDGDSFLDWFEDSSPTLGFANTLPGEPELFHYGVGCAGSIGEPVIGTAFGPPALGNVSFELRLTKALPLAPALLALSPGEAHIQAYGCVLQIDFAQTGFVLLGPTTVTRARTAAFPMPVPHDATLLGVKVFVQGGVFDPSAPEGIAFTRGLEMTL